MHEAAADLRFEYAARLRDEVNERAARAPESRLIVARQSRGMPMRIRVAALTVRGVTSEHHPKNLRSTTSNVRRDKLIVFTGLSGSGKSSLAFDTIYAEGQRRYVESLSAYARQFLGQMDKPDVDFIEGLSPAISIDQKSASRNPRSTVGTITEVYDYLRLLYARIGAPHCPEHGDRRRAPDAAADRRPARRAAGGHPLPGAGARGAGPQGRVRDAARGPAAQGFVRAVVDGEVVDICEFLKDGDRLARYEQHTIEVVVDRLVRREGIDRRLTDSLETALSLAEGVAEIELVPARGGSDGSRPTTLTFSQHLACPVRRVVRGAGAAQLLVQLAVRGLRALRRPRHPLRGRPRAGRPRTRTCRWARAPSPRGARPARSTSARMLEAVADAYDIDLDTPWSKLTEGAAEGPALTA